MLRTRLRQPSQGTLRPQPGKTGAIRSTNLPRYWYCYHTTALTSSTKPTIWRSAPKEQSLTDAHHHLWKVTPEEVGGEEGKPGPVVFLLGCRTAESELLPYQNFARSFQLNNASIVVATLATVFGEHAAPVANEFIARLLDASNAGKAFGEVLRDVRLAMFSHGYLMALALVAFGNADWILPAAKGTVDVSN